MGITVLFNEPYFLGTTPSSPLVPWPFDVALNGRPYMLDLKSNEYMHRSVPQLRQQADQSRTPSETSINPEDLWRRSQDTWHQGAGQSVLDREDSSPARFDTSKGVDVWDRWSLSLLPATDDKRTSTNTNLALAVAGTFLYLTDGASIVHTQDITVATPTWTDITGEPATAAKAITSDGNTIYTAHGANGIFSTTRGAASTASFATGTVSLVAYVKGRLMAAEGAALYNVTASGALPAALFTHPNADFVWTGFAEGHSAIYAVGFSGDKSLIYKIGIQTGGTGLDVPIVAGELPDGEIVRSAVGYLGQLLIGTDNGLRLTTVDENGNLTIGARVPTTSAVKAFEPQDRFVWFGWTNFDSVSTGLGRVDLTSFVTAGAPAHASDLMVTAQGAVGSIVTFQNRRVFTVSASGVWGEDTIPVAVGTLDTGRFTYAFPHRKIAAFVDVVHDSVGKHSVHLSTNGKAFNALGTHTTSDAPFPINAVAGNDFELRLTLTAVTNVSPVIRSVTLRAYPAAPTVVVVLAPLLLYETVRTRTGEDFSYDVAAELDAIRNLHGSRLLTSWQENNAQFSMVVEDYEWRPHHLTRDNNAFNGTLLVKLKSII